MKKIVWIYGLIAGTIVSVVMFLSDFNSMESQDMGMSEVIGYTVMLLAFIMILFGIKAVRDKVQGGVISFGKAFAVGLFISLIASTMYVGSWMIISNTTAKDFIGNYTEIAIEKIEADDSLTPDEKKEKIQSARDMEEMYENQMYRALITYFEILPLGILLSLIFALILKRKEPKVAVEN